MIVETEWPPTPFPLNRQWFVGIIVPPWPCDLEPPAGWIISEDGEQVAMLCFENWN